MSGSSARCPDTGNDTRAVTQMSTRAEPPLSQRVVKLLGVLQVFLRIMDRAEDRLAALVTTAVRPQHHRAADHAAVTGFEVVAPELHVPRRPALELAAQRHRVIEDPAPG